MVKRKIKDATKTQNHEINVPPTAGTKKAKTTTKAKAATKSLKHKGKE